MSVMRKKRGGVLLHPTALPGASDAIGTLGREAYAFVDWMEEGKMSVWQVLPLNPTGYGDSPYASFSAFAGNPYLIDLTALCEIGDLSKEELENYSPPGWTMQRVDFSWLYENKLEILYAASQTFSEKGSASRKKAFRKFCEKNRDWLDRYALFMALKQMHGGVSWNEWPVEHRSCGDIALLENEVDKCYLQFQKYINWQFFTQWTDLKKYANTKGVQIVGDAPIFVAYDSADVWGQQELFKLREDGVPEAVAGVPPDYFSETGQLWGNPLYRWDVMASQEFAWWKKRVQHLLSLVDVARIDHFRGFAQYWQVPYGEETAINGAWIDAPGEQFFNSLQEQFGDDLPVVAEDLGLITEDVIHLRDQFSLPGMRIFEFAPWGEEGFDDNGVWRPFDEHTYLPANYPANCVAYLGTHDNDTFLGWYLSLNTIQQAHLADFLSADSNLHWHAVESLWGSGANLVVISGQDLLGLGSDARFNVPGLLDSSNWSWRLSGEQFKDLNNLTVKISKLNEQTGRSC